MPKHQSSFRQDMGNEEPILSCCIACLTDERVRYGLVGVAVLLGVWQVLSLFFHQIIIASPLATLTALSSLLVEQRTWEYIGITSLRLFTGLFLGSIIGLGLGLIAGMSRKIRLMLEPLRWAAMTVPAIVIAIIAMLWFGMGSYQVIFVVTIIVVPITYVNAMEGRHAIDERLIEMGRTFNLSQRMFLSEIYLPGITASVIAGLTLTAGMGVRVVMLSEFMGAHDGIGYGLQRSWTFLDTPGLFAWILIAFALMGILEFCIMRPLKDHLLRWKKAGTCE